ncbi:hypothetical protein UA31_21565 [Photobacterium angustum]|nr:hypothetical protein UB36_21560 [Photobacterium damselae subsp. damselae]KJG15128.1 hypothetical protein UA33_21060 [Photobacterium angustum]KJG19811.1 hypothetical protein UA39_20985 [Photobacterium angustum]KJG42386.1 hypothetical protein UA31_21565 [Photobacterium angustum]KJG44210.1 hypothetical protein UA30_21410 [Photobacterium angustum]
MGDIDMQISSLTVHCASLCLDVVNGESFEKLTMADIQSWQDELYSYIENRVEIVKCSDDKQRLFITSVRDEVLIILMLSKENLFAREPHWILEKMQRKIALSTHLYINNSAL